MNEFVAVFTEGRSLGDFVGFSGWLLVAWVIRMLFTGRLITGREADERDERYDKKVEECTQLRAAVAAFSDGLEPINAVIATVLEENQRQQARPPARSRTTGGNVRRED